MACGVGDEELEGALEAHDPKAALIALVMAVSMPSGGEDEESQQVEEPRPDGTADRESEGVSGDGVDEHAAIVRDKARTNSPTAAEIAAAMKKKLGHSPPPAAAPTDANPPPLADDLGDLEDLADGTCIACLFRRPIVISFALSSIVERYVCEY